MTAALTLTTGCFLGSTPQKKQSTYVLNGLGILVGGTLAIGAATADDASWYPSSTCHEGADGSRCNSNFVPGEKVFGLVGAALAAAATVMTIVTIAVPTTPEPKRGALVQPGVTTGVVKAPGLAPVSVTLR